MLGRFLAVGAAALACAHALAQEPNSEADLLARVAANAQDAEARLQLGRIYFDRGNDRAADFNLRQALAGELSPEAIDEANALLEALQKRRAWIFSIDGALAPRATQRVNRLEDIDGDGEPETVQATEESGLGVVLRASGENRLALSDSTRLSTQIFVDIREYEGIAFDDATLTILSGPLFLLEGDDRWSVRPLVQRRWFAGRKEFDAYGVEIAGQKSLTPRLRAFSRFTYRELDYDVFDARDGQTYSLDGDLSLFGDRGALTRGFFVAFRDDAVSEAQAFWFGRIGAGAYRELPLGLGVYIEPSVAFQDFDGPDPASGEERTDTRYEIRGRVVKRDWRIFGTAPFVSVEASRIDSTAPGFGGTSTGVGFGFTRTF